MTARNLSDMQPDERRAVLLRVAGKMLLVWIVVFGAYFVLPVGNDSSGQAIIHLVIDVILIVGVILWQARSILHADYPEVRAIEALVVIVAVFLALFASLYLALSHSSRLTFSEPLDHIRALYFTITVFSTVGFGDIVARSDGARAVVSAQMLLDLILLGAVVRILLTAVRTGLGRSQEASVAGQGAGVAGGEVV